MKNGLANWHYPHRTLLENITFFAAHGFEAQALLGYQFLETLRKGGEAAGDAVADAIRRTGTVMTLHHKLPVTHSVEDVYAFFKDIQLIAAWQKKHGLLQVLSFDVEQPIRNAIGDYVDHVLQTVPDVRVAVEDFGLTAAELAQIEHLKNEPRFGYLLDIGHMYLRFCGRNTRGLTLFSNSGLECPVCENPGYDAFMRAFGSKTFPVFEIHLHNNDGQNDLHWFLPDGPLDMQDIARVLRDIGFDGILTIESAPGFQFPCYGQQADEGILKTLDHWKTCTQATVKGEKQ